MNAEGPERRFLRLKISRDGENSFCHWREIPHLGKIQKVQINSYLFFYFPFA